MRALARTRAQPFPGGEGRKRVAHTSYGLVGLGDASGLTPWRLISFSACRFRVVCCPIASRFTLSAHAGQIELVSTSRIPQIMHIFAFSAIHVSFPCT